MIKNERLDKIIEILEKENYSTVDHLAKLLFVAPVTIRRDLKKLEQNGLVNTCYGGVSLMHDPNKETPWITRKKFNNVIKKQLAKKAAGLIPSGSTVFLDASSTVSYILECLEPEKNITIITNGMQALSLATQKHIKAYSTGGKVVDNSFALTGAIAMRAVQSMYANLMFFSSNGISQDGHITDQSESETELRKVMLANSDKRYFLCDSSKLGKSFLFHVCHASELDDVICDQPFSFSSPI